jgi:hypothetical protein
MFWTKPRNETKVGQALSPVQMWGRRSRLPIRLPPGAGMVH